MGFPAEMVMVLYNHEMQAGVATEKPAYACHTELRMLSCGGWFQRRPLRMGNFRAKHVLLTVLLLSGCICLLVAELVRRNDYVLECWHLLANKGSIWGPDVNGGSWSAWMGVSKIGQWPKWLSKGCFLWYWALLESVEKRIPSLVGVGSLSKHHVGYPAQVY